MPTAPPRLCSHPGCGVLVQGGRCAKHKKAKRKQYEEGRPSAAKRGYGRYWREVVRPTVLREYGIPEDDWHLYEIDHDPPYNPEVDANHWNYTLTPLTHSEHGRKTSTHDGGFGNPRR